MNLVVVAVFCLLAFVSFVVEGRDTSLSLQSRSLPEDGKQAMIRSTTTVPVTFEINQAVAFGEAFLVVGSAKELGSWDITSATLMTVSGSSSWTFSTRLPVGEDITFKLVLVDESSLTVVKYMPDPSLSLTVPTDYGTMLVAVYWDPSNTSLKMGA